MLRRVPLPEQLVEHARDFAEGRREPVEPKNAATVLLLRPGAEEGPGAPEVYFLRRQTSMAFAGGMFAFPGGAVDPRDFDTGVGWAGPGPEEWARRLDVDQERARALVIAAVRETFEESGVLLAGEHEDDVVADTTGEDWEADRVALENHHLPMTAFLQRRGLLLRTDLLAPWAAWTTPLFEPRRYATWFFVAQLPEGQRTRDVSRESDQVTWMSASQALAGVEAGEVQMLPPTYFTCLEVAQHAEPAAVMAEGSGRTLRMFMPEAVRAGGEWTLSTPPELNGLLEARG